MNNPGTAAGYSDLVLITSNLIFYLITFSLNFYLITINFSKTDPYLLNL